MSFKEAGQTKALLDTNTFVTPGNQVKVYDYYTQGPNSNVSTGYYISGDLAQSNGSSWPFVNNKYEWTPDGEHKFFGWLEKDNNDQQSPITASDFFGEGFGMDGQVLKVPTKTFDANTPQFDFMYSDIEMRNLNTQLDYSPVQLGFKHLFTAFSISAADNSKYLKFKINSVELIKMHATNSATIDYSVGGDNPTVEYGTATSGKGYMFDLTEDIELVSGYKDLSTGELVKEKGRQYFLVWPQSNMACTFRVTYSVAPDGDVDDDVITKDGDEYEVITKDIVIPYAWNAGQKNNINLDFSDKKIELNYQVEPWTHVPEELDFTDQVTIAPGGTISWDEDTILDVNYTTGEVFLTNDEDKEATCEFTILTPKGATWTASLISRKGHPDAFRFVEGTKYGPVGVKGTIKLAVTNEDPISPLHECELLITVQTADGRTIRVDDLLTPEEDEDGVPTTYTRFRIIQNLNN